MTPLRELARKQGEAIAGRRQPASASFVFKPQIAYRLRRDKQRWRSTRCSGD
jgi:hypothetical protein